MKLVIYGDIGGSGGYIRYCKGLLCSNSIPNDIAVWFICSQDFYNKLGVLDQNIDVITHPWMTSKSRLKRYLWYLWVYPRIIKKIKPNVEFYPSGQLRVYLRKALSVTTCHNLLLFDPNELGLISNENEKRSFDLYRKNQISSYLKSKTVIFLSNHSQKVVTKYIKGIKKSTIISHGLDPVFLLPEKRSYELKNNIKLLYVSPFYTYKHQIEVVKAVNSIRLSLELDVSIQLIGGGSCLYVKELEEFVTKNNFQNFVKLVGDVNYDDLLTEYRSADIFVFASSCETFGITVLEAMGSRLPIACSNRTGLPDILKDSGLYFDPDHPSSISEAIKQLILDNNLRETLGEKAYQYALDYTWERCAKETFNYIKEIK